MAVFVLLAGATGARLITANLSPFSYHRLRSASLLIVTGSTIGTRFRRGLHLHLFRLATGFFLALLLQTFHFIITADLEAVQHPDQFMLDLV